MTKGATCQSGPVLNGVHPDGQPIITAETGMNKDNCCNLLPGGTNRLLMIDIVSILKLCSDGGRWCGGA